MGQVKQDYMLYLGYLLFKWIDTQEIMETWYMVQAINLNFNTYHMK